jgi:hypothetical protein
VNKEKKVSSGNYLWISFFWSYLNENGRAGFVMSSQASSAGNKEAEVRRKIVETGDVDVIISIRAYEMQNIDSTLTHHSVLHRQTLSAIEMLSQLPERITVLFMAANPLDQKELRLDEEVRAINEMITKSKHRNAVKLESRWAVRPLDVLQAINELRPRVVHFSGHGSDQDEIVFQDNEGQTKLVSKEAIVQTMAAASGDIKLVFFNTCYSHNQAEAVVKHVAAAMGMNTSIGDDAARVFAAQFYSALGFGLSVNNAFQQAKAALMLEGIKEEETPELFVADGIDPDQLILVKPQED